MSDASFDVWTAGADASEFRKLLKVLTALCAVFALSIIMFGIGEGNVVRLPRPGEVSPDDAIGERMRLYSKETRAVEVLADNGTSSYLCASQDGQRVFFTTGMLAPDHDSKAYLVENNGKPREIKLKLPE